MQLHHSALYVVSLSSASASSTRGFILLNVSQTTKGRLPQFPKEVAMMNTRLSSHGIPRRRVVEIMNGQRGVRQAHTEGVVGRRVDGGSSAASACSGAPGAAKCRCVLPRGPACCVQPTHQSCHRPEGAGDGEAAQERDGDHDADQLVH